MRAKLYFLETRPQFLILSVILVFFAASISYYYGTVHLGYTFLSLIGLLLLHISVNTLNDYFDYKSGIDIRTQRTPFSGGSGLLTSGKLSPNATLRLGISSFLLAIPIGAYFILARGWFLLPLFILGAILVLGYTPGLTKIGYGSAEFSAGLGLGTLPVWGISLILHPAFSWPILFASIPSGFLVTNLLFLNEFPDIKADKLAKRKTLPIQFGRHNAAILYALLVSAVYLWVIYGVVFKLMPPFSLLALLTIPFALKAVKISFAYKTIPELIPALAANVLVVLLTQFFIAIGYLLAKII